MTLWNATDLTEVSECDLREMADTLAALGYAPDAAAETEELLVMLRQWKIRSEVRINRLAAVWRAAGRDSSERHIRQELAKYRGEHSLAQADPQPRASEWLPYGPGCVGQATCTGDCPVHQEGPTP